jgi:photosystem II stability/assembly factor-like uncharacterized protein
MINPNYDHTPSSPRDTIRGGVTDAARGVGMAAAFSGAASVLGAMPAAAKGDKRWKKVEVPFKETLFDISFDKDKPDHGWIVGAKGTFLETFDGGNNWAPRTFNSLDEDEEINYRFEVTSLNSDEGWIVGKPTIMLHTRDGGKQFERIPMSPKLPGEPVSIKATSVSKAEMITSQGAIYTTENGGLNWKAQVKETIDATLNRVSSSGTSGASFFSGKIINQVRDVNGNWLAISSRGNLFLTWSPGQDYWVPHNRGSSRRIQNMGFIGNDVKNGMWMTLNGGALLKTSPNPDLNQVDIEALFKPAKINSGGYGIIDVCWKNDKEVYAVGGSGIIFESKDGGDTFKFVPDAKDVPGNLYRVKFFGDNGWALGSDGVLLKYT